MTSSTLHRMFAAIGLLFVGAAVVWGFILVGSPGMERLRKIDARRVEDLRAIENAVRQLCMDRDGSSRTLSRPLPATLGELVEHASRRGISKIQYTGLNISDPETGAAYGYTITGESTYELCATFSLPRDDPKDPWWNHPAGNHRYAVDLLAR